jgi:hypothetical protein
LIWIQFNFKLNVKLIETIINCFKLKKSKSERICAQKTVKLKFSLCKISAELMTKNKRLNKFNNYLFNKSINNLFKKKTKIIL